MGAKTAVRSAGLQSGVSCGATEVAPYVLLAILALALSVAACSSRPGREAASPPSLTVADEVVRLGISGATNAGAGVAASGDRVVVTWAATVGEKTNVYAATSLDEGRTFAGPVRVNDVGGDARMSGEQAPRITLGRDLAIGWVSRLGGQSSIRVARSTDDGRSFAPARSLHPPALAGLRGWPSFTMGDGDVVHAAWLDTRQAAAENAAHAAHGSTAHQAAQGHHGSTRQDLFHASASADGTWTETTVATDVCFCCKTAVTTAPDGVVYVAWRHVYPTNLRDIAVAHSGDGGRTFSEPVRVSEDHWQIDACPEDGPSIAVTDDGVLHVAWPTMLQDGDQKKAVFYASSSDGGRTFSPRVRIDQAGEKVHAGHPQIARAGGRVFVVWDETTGTGFRIQLREVGPAAGVGSIATLSDDGSATYPAIAGTRSSVVAAWTRRSAGQSEIVVRRIGR